MRSKATALALLLMCICGCTHDRSYKKDNEVTSIRLLTPSQLCNNTSAGTTWQNADVKDYRLATALYQKLSGHVCKKPTEDMEIAMAPILAAGVGYLANYGINFISDEIKKEAKKHHATFDVVRYFKNDPLDKYYAVEITRSVEDSKNAYKLIVGYWLDETEAFYWAAPIYFETKLAKPKVSKSKAKLTSTTNISFTSLWAEQTENYKYNKQEIAKLAPVVVTHYNLDGDFGIVPQYDDEGNGAKGEKSGSVSFKCIKSPFPLIPSTSYEKNVGGVLKKVNDINLWIQADVSEVDESKVEKYLTEAAAGLDKNKDKIVEAAKKPIK